MRKRRPESTIYLGEDLYRELALYRGGFHVAPGMSAIVREAVRAEDADVALLEGLRLRVTLRTPPDLHIRSLHLARVLRASRTQDAAYLALAEDCPLSPVFHPAVES